MTYDIRFYDFTGLLIAKWNSILYPKSEKCDRNWHRLTEGCQFCDLNRFWAGLKFQYNLMWHTLVRSTLFARNIIKNKNFFNIKIHTDPNYKIIENLIFRTWRKSDEIVFRYILVVKTLANTFKHNILKSTGVSKVSRY